MEEADELEEAVLVAAVAPSETSPAMSLSDRAMLGGEHAAAAAAAAAAVATKTAGKTANATAAMAQGLRQAGVPTTAAATIVALRLDQTKERETATSVVATHQQQTRIDTSVVAMQHRPGGRRRTKIAMNLVVVLHRPGTKKTATGSVDDAGRPLLLHQGRAPDHVPPQKGSASATDPGAVMTTTGARIDVAHETTITGDARELDVTATTTTTKSQGVADEEQQKTTTTTGDHRDAASLRPRAPLPRHL